jgi:phosphate transport system protein
MQRPIDQELNALRALILAMGKSVESSVEAATQGLIERKSERLDGIREIENKINQSHLEIDEKCFHVIATQNPTAEDLRTIWAVIKINSDLERMGDQAMNISYSVRDYLKKPPIDQVSRIKEMAVVVRKMITDSLEAFIQGNTDLAEEVLIQDDTVDEGKNDMVRDLVTLMKTEAHQVDGAVDLMLIARNLERLGDHATNIAEDVIFASTGKDIRHGGFVPGRS